MKLHKCRIRNTKVYHCHLCSEKFVQLLSFSHHIRQEHWNSREKKIVSGKSKAKIKLKCSGVNKELSERKQNERNLARKVNSGQKILLKIKAGTCMTLISPSKEEKSSHVKHKKKKMKKKFDKERPPAVSLKNGLVLTIRPALTWSESKKASKKRIKSRTKLKASGSNTRKSTVEQTSGLKLKIRTNQGNNHIILNSAAEQKVPKLVVSKRNLEKIPKASSNKKSGSVIASKNIVKKYKNKMFAAENAVESPDSEYEQEDIDDLDKKKWPESISRVKNGVIIHKDRLGNYTSAEQIGKTKTKKTHVQKYKAAIWEVSKAEQIKSAKVKKTDIPRFTKGLWEIMSSPRPDGTSDLLKIRLSPQKPLRLDTNQETLLESARCLDVDAKSKGDTLLGEDSDTFGASPATEKDLDLGINSVNDSGIEVLSSSSCNRSNGNSVRSVLLDENSPSYFHGEDSLMSFDSPINDSSKYEHSICCKCGGIVMEPNNNTQSPTKCHCDSSAIFPEKPSYICISPLKDPSVSVLDEEAVPKFKMDEKTTMLVNVATEGFDSPSDVACTDGQIDRSKLELAVGSHDDMHQQAVEKSVFDFNEDEDFSEGKPVLDHVKNPLVLNKTEDEKKQESILLGDLQEMNQSQIPKKKSNSKSNKLSRSPRKKAGKAVSENIKSAKNNRNHEIGNISSKPIVIEDEDDVLVENYEDLKHSVKLKTTGLMECKKPDLSEQIRKSVLNDKQGDYSLQLKNNVLCDANESIIVAIAKSEKSAASSSESDTASKNTDDIKNNEDDNDVDDNKTSENEEQNNFGTDLGEINIVCCEAAQKSDINGLQSKQENGADIETKKDISNIPLLEMNELVQENTCESLPNGMNDQADKEINNAYSDIEEIKIDSCVDGQCLTFEDTSLEKETKLSEEDCKTDILEESGSGLQETKSGTGEKPHAPVADINNSEDGTFVISAENAELKDDAADLQEIKSIDGFDAVSQTRIGNKNVKELKLCLGESEATSLGKVVSVHQMPTPKFNRKQIASYVNASDEDSLLQIPIIETVKDANVSLSLKSSESKTAVVLNSDEDSLMTIPVAVSTDVPVKSSVGFDKKSPLDLFQQQFLSFLSSKPPESTDSDKDAVVDVTVENENENTDRDELMRQEGTTSEIKMFPECHKSVAAESQRPLVSKIRDTDSESDFDSVNHRKKGRRKSYLNERKTEGSSHDRLKRTSVLKETQRDTDFDGDLNNSDNVECNKTPKEHDGISDSDSDFETRSLYGKDRKKSFVKRTRNNSDVSCGKKRKFKDFDTDESDFVLGKSDGERFSSDDSDMEGYLTGHIRTEHKWKAYKEKDYLTRNASSINMVDFKKEDRNSLDLADNKSTDSADFRSQRLKRGRKSCCPCCLGSPRMGRKERHRHKKRYKLPDNHKQFIADTVRLLELKAKIHRLFLTLFPQCEELIKQSAFDTLAFDDIIDDVLSSVMKTEIQFEPNNDILTESVTTFSHETSVEQVIGEHLNLQSSESSMDTKLDTSGTAVNESLCCLMDTSSPVLFVPSIQLMYPDDSVINTSPVTNIDLQENNSTVTSANLLPPLPLCDLENSKETEENASISDSVDDNLVANTTVEQTELSSKDLLESNDNSSTTGSKNSIDDVSLETSAQDVPVSHDTLQIIPVSTSTDLGSSSQSEIQLNVPSDTQFCLSNDVNPAPDKSMEEIVITIDLNAAKVLLCKNPKACLKQLHSRVISLIQCFYPDLQISPLVYESLENLEFLIELMTMSNRSGSFEGSVETPSLIATDVRFVSSDSTNPSENISIGSSAKSTSGQKYKSRVKSDDNNSRQLRTRSCDDDNPGHLSKQTKKSLKRTRTVSVENNSESKKKKTCKSILEKSKSSLVNNEDSTCEESVKGNAMSEKPGCSESSCVKSIFISGSSNEKFHTGKCKSHPDHRDFPVKAATTDLAGSVKGTKKFTSKNSKLSGKKDVVKTKLVSSNTKKLKTVNCLESPKDTSEQLKTVGMQSRVKVTKKFFSEKSKTLKQGESRVKVTKKFFSEKSKTSKKGDDVKSVLFSEKAKSDSRDNKDVSEQSQNAVLTNVVEVTKKHVSEKSKTEENSSDIKSEFVKSRAKLKDKSLSSDSSGVSLQSHSHPDLELEGMVNDQIDKVLTDKNEMTTDSPSHSPFSHLMRTPSPEKAPGGFSQDMKRRSIDKNIFELLQPNSTDTSV